MMITLWEERKLPTQQIFLIANVISFFQKNPGLFFTFKMEPKIKIWHFLLGMD